MITKSTSDKPYDTLGGILADTMGVGKTLTMIASIASSQKEEKYNVQPADSEEHSMTWKPSHNNSTLILVPSVRKLFCSTEEVFSCLVTPNLVLSVTRWMDCRD